MDIGAAIKAPMEDSDWLKKSLLIGLMMLIPVAGAFNAVGWMLAVYKNARSGSKELPEANLSYIMDGLWVAVALLPLMIVPFVLMIIVQVALAVVNSSIIAIVGGILMLVVYIGVGVLAPAALLLHFEKGYRFSGLKFGEMIPIVTGNVGPYIMFLVISFVASIIAGLGSVACGLGMLLTAPLAYAINAHGLAQLAKEAKLGE